MLTPLADLAGFAKSADRSGTDLSTNGHTMGDAPLLQIGCSPVERPSDASDVVDAPGEIPAWLAARRSRSDSALNESTVAVPNGLEIEFEEVSVPNSESEPIASMPVSSNTRTLNASGLGLNLVVPDTPLPQTEFPESKSKALQPAAVVDSVEVSPQPFNLFGSKSKPKKVAPKGALPILSDDPKPHDLTWKELIEEWTRGPGMKGVLVSLLVHSIVVSALAFIVMGGGKVNQGLDIFGIVGDSDDRLLSAVELDSSVTIVPAADSGGPEFADVTQFVNTESAMFDPNQAIRGGKGGTGHGVGNGDGDAVLPPVNVPGYAVTKGSFSAWTEPRDPEPGQMYEIIIQFRLPPNVKTYRGSDLTGMVTGTDLYKQAIRFQRNESFPVVDGAVRIKISVPGAARLVRDTIRIESKILREKQVLEIEF